MKAGFQSMMRGVALFLAGFTLLGVVSGVRHERLAMNLWWIDLRPLPRWVQLGVLVGMAAVMAGWSCRPAMSVVRRRVTIGMVGVCIAFVVKNIIGFYWLRSRGWIFASLPVPVSAGVLLGLLGMWRAVGWRVARLRIGWLMAGMGVCVVAFPLMQIAGFGQSDYRRRADAILVLGARVYADGKPSDALEDRLLTAIELYDQGLARRLIFSGGPGDGAISEPQSMRRFTMARGVPDEAIVLDERGLTTDDSIRNTVQRVSEGQSVLTVSHGWHLPRIKLRAQAAGLEVYTVPADERGRPLARTPQLVVREVAALWVYFFRTVLG